MSWRLELGDCLEVMRALPENSVDALVTDPPAGIGFMGRAWDSNRGGRDAWIGWMAEVMGEARRVLKPGAHALVWAIPRTSHWTATALEDAGFEIRDVITHHFGTGFPKSLDVSKAIDAAAGAEREVVGRRNDGGRGGGTGVFDDDAFVWKTELDVTAPATPEAERWQGWGTALKPASEHWILARAPISGTIAANVLEHGAGALNIDATRIGYEPADLAATRAKNPGRDDLVTSGTYGAGRPQQQVDAAGRWPPNVAFTHAPDCGAQCVDGCPVQQLDEQSGITFSTSRPRNNSARENQSMGVERANVTGGYDDSGAASRFFPVFRWNDADFLYTPKPDTAERDQGLEAYDLRSPGELTNRVDGSAGLNSPRAGGRGRRRNFHPTVKPIDLMRWLCRLITPPGGVVLDPFAGSGTTLAAALREGFSAIGIEQDADYYALAESRIVGDSPLFNLGARL